MHSGTDKKVHGLYGVTACRQQGKPRKTMPAMRAAVRKRGNRLRGYLMKAVTKVHDAAHPVNPPVPAPLSSAPLPAVRLILIAWLHLDGLWALLLPVLVLVGLRGGIFTATEAGVVAVVYAFIVGVFVYRELKPKILFKALIAGAKMSAVVMFLAATAQVAAYMLTISRIPQVITESLAPLVAHPMLLNIVLQVIIILMGTCVDVVPTILIMTPIMLPLLRAAHIDFVYFGIVFTLANVLGLTSPPVGPVLNVACATGKVKMEDLLPPVIPYYIFQMILVFILILFPEIVTVPLKWFAGYSASPMDNVVTWLMGGK